VAFSIPSRDNPGMTSANLLRLIFLAAIWGGSFLFMRIAAPVLGAAVLIEYRVLFAALFLAAMALALKKPLHLRLHWKHYLILGLLNSALPFLLFAFAARTLSASLMAVLNASTPLWGTLIAAVWSRHMVSARVLVGLVLGACGVALLVGFDHVSTQPGAGLAIVAVLCASFMYGVASNYTRSAASAQGVEPFANAHGSMWTSALLVLPVVPFFPAPATPTMGVMAAVVSLGILCSGVAYLIYFRLIQDVGPSSALTVTFLSPLFGILWGVLFLGETVGWYTFAGAAIVIVGTALVTGFRPNFGTRKVRPS
jgi:drug/metabolite transporter (DMT)-like permease